MQHTYPRPVTRRNCKILHLAAAVFLSHKFTQLQFWYSWWRVKMYSESENSRAIIFITFFCYYLLPTGQNEVRWTNKQLVNGITLCPLNPEKFVYQFFLYSVTAWKQYEHDTNAGDMRQIAICERLYSYQLFNRQRNVYKKSTLMLQVNRPRHHG